MWDATTHKQTAVLKCQHGRVWNVKHSPDGNIIAIGYDDGTVVLSGTRMQSQLEWNARRLAGKET